MKKKVLIGIALILAFSMTAAAWDVLGHAFIMEQLRGGAGQANGNELYGITAPDFVNYLLPTPWYGFLYGQTHENFMALYTGALTPAEKALAVGFLAHNGVWGADHVAHHASLTIGDPEHGYVVNKAMQLEQIYAGMGVWSGLGIGGAEYETFRLELCHNVVEYAIDIAIWSIDPGLPSRLAAAAAVRAPSMGRLVVAAYAEPLVAYSLGTAAPLNLDAAAAILQPAEAAFKQRIITYAGLFIGATSAEEVLGNMDPYVRGLAADMFGLVLDEGQAAQLIGLALLPGFNLFDDLAGELTATIGYVGGGLVSHNIGYAGPGKSNKPTAPKGILKK